jgi:hypothetical protein
MFRWFQSLQHGDRAVIVTVPVVDMMQPPVHEVIHMVAVRNGLMSAARAVDVRARRGVWRTAIGVRAADGNAVFVVVVAVRRVQVAIVEVVHVIIVLNACMPAGGVMGVGVVGVGCTARHWMTPFRWIGW